MIQELYDHILTEVAAATGVNVVKGFPNWGRPALTTPVAALEILSWFPSRPTRIGEKRARQSIQLQLWVFARHEPELTELLDSIATWDAGKGPTTVDGNTVEFTMSEGQRHFSTTGTEQEDHAFRLILNAAWTG